MTWTDRGATTTDQLPNQLCEDLARLTAKPVLVEVAERGALEVNLDGHGAALHCTRTLRSPAIASSAMGSPLGPLVRCRSRSLPLLAPRTGALAAAVALAPVTLLAQPHLLTTPLARK
jgi:hypothetical protein